MAYTRPSELLGLDEVDSPIIKRKKPVMSPATEKMRPKLERDFPGMVANKVKQIEQVTRAKRNYNASATSEAEREGMQGGELPKDYSASALLKKSAIRALPEKAQRFIEDADKPSILDKAVKKATTPIGILEKVAEPVTEAFGKAGEAMGSAFTPALPTGPSGRTAISPKDTAGARIGRAAGEFVGSSIVPTTPLDVTALAAPGAVKAVRKVAPVIDAAAGRAASRSAGSFLTDDVLRTLRAAGHSDADIAIVNRLADDSPAVARLVRDWPEQAQRLKPLLDEARSLQGAADKAAGFGRTSGVSRFLQEVGTKERGALSMGDDLEALLQKSLENQALKKVNPEAAEAALRADRQAVDEALNTQRAAENTVFRNRAVNKKRASKLSSMMDALKDESGQLKLGDIIQDEEARIATGKAPPKQQALTGFEWQPGSKTPVWRSGARALGDVATVLPRALGTAFDYSYPFRQGGLLVRNMKDFAPNFAKGLKALASEEYALARQAQIEKAPFNPRTLELTSFAKDAKFTQREEDFMSRLSNYIPGLKQAGRAATVFINGLRSDMANRVARSWMKAGLDPRDPKFISDLEAYGNYLNRATGRGNLGEFENAVGALNQVFYGARRNVAMVQVPGYLFNSSPRVRAEAWKDMLGFFGTGMATLKLADLAGADVGIDPTSADFGKIKVGRTRVDIWGGYQQLARTIYKIADAQIDNPGESKETSDAVLSFLRNKLSPQAGLAVDVTEGQNAIGEPFGTPGNIGQTTGLNLGPLGNEALKRYVPLGIDGLLEAMKEEGVRGAFLGGTGLFGTGVQTYATTGDVRNEEAQRQFGQDYGSLMPTQQFAVNQSDSVKQQMAESPSPYQKAVEREIGPVQERWVQAEEAFKAGDLTQKITDLWHDLNIEIRAKKETLVNEYLSDFKGDKDAFRKMVDRYYAQEVRNSDGTIDWDATEAQQQRLVDSLSPTEQAWLKDYQASLKLDDSPLRREYLDYIDQKEAAGYFRDGISQAEREALDKSNPELDVEGWYFGGGVKGVAPPALQSAAAIDLALQKAPDRPVKLDGLTRPINQDEGSLAGWEYSKKPVAWYLGDLLTQNGDAEAQRLFKSTKDKGYNKPFAELDSEHRSAVARNLHAEARKNPELEAWLYWWGVIEKPDAKAFPYIEQIFQKYGKAPPK